jgi:hypothetical protein
MKKPFPLSLLLLSGMSTLNGMDTKKPLDLLAATQSGAICVSRFTQKVTKSQPCESRDLAPHAPQELKLYALSDPHTKSTSLAFALLPNFGYPCFNPDGTQAPIEGYKNIQKFLQALGHTADQKTAMAFLNAFKKSQEERSNL